MSSPAGIKKHVCHRCGRGFARREHLQRHERSHTKEQPFRCIVCPQAFTRKDLLVRHRRLNHALNPHDGAGTSQQRSLSNVPNPGDDTMPSVPMEDATLNQVPNLSLVQPSDAGRHEDIFDLFDFAAFADSVALPSHLYSPSYQPLPILCDEVLDSWHLNDAPRGQRHEGNSLASEPPNEPGGLSRYGSRLPSLDADERATQIPSGEHGRDGRYPQMSPSCWERIKAGLGSLAPISMAQNDFVSPSRHAFNRYVHGYFRGFHPHYPMFHLPTLTLDEMPVELLLSMASVGAQYCLEQPAGFKLFHLAKSIAIERACRRGATTSDKRVSVADVVYAHTTYTLHTVQTFVLLTAVSMWSEDTFREALSIRSVLEGLLHDEALNEGCEPNPGTWTDWVKWESIRRVKVIVYCFFNMQTIVFDVPPMMLLQDVYVEFPCFEKEWEARNVEEWGYVHREQFPNMNFQDAFGGLFAAGDEYNEQPIAFSPLASHALIHGVIQRTWLLQQAARLPGSDEKLHHSDVIQLERALKRWQSGWERDEEASAIPTDSHGPMSFTATALLRLAYIRINMDPGAVPHSTSTWSPERIAADFVAVPPAQRSVRATRAALHCAHGLSIPIKLGIDFVARTQVFFWSNQYAQCSLESALFLTKWLEAVTTQDLSEPLAFEESRLLEFVLQMVAETEYAAESRYFLATPKRLGIVIVRLWAKLFRVDSVWQLVGLIGRSLVAYAELLESTDRSVYTEAATVPPQ